MIIIWAVAIFVVCGSFLMLVAALGVVRFPDVYTRMHAASKSVSLGLVCMLIALAILFNTPMIILKSIAGIIFVFLTIPVASHMIGRAAYLRKVPLYEKTSVDQMAGLYKKNERESNE
jgi:multicomponent Na+:H+ antiporter subunit G